MNFLWFQIRGSKDPVLYVRQHAEILITHNKQTFQVNARALTKVA